MKRRIIEIDQERCNGCGLCVDACHEGAIGLVDGKATLLRDDYCDGLGDCLPHCPTDAISFVEREALPYDEAAVEENLRKKKKQTAEAPAHTGGCPGKKVMSLKRTPGGCPGSKSQVLKPKTAVQKAVQDKEEKQSSLNQWPVQIKLVPVNASYFDGAKLLVAADCTAYAYANFHEDFIRDRITLIGCPKLDEGDYKDKLKAILENNDIKELTIVRMEVPCCGGLERAATEALRESGKFIPWQVKTISVNGEILD